MFLRGMPHLCAKMKRPTSKGASTKDQAGELVTEPAPDFYAMSRLQPLPENGAVSPLDGPSDTDELSEQGNVRGQNSGAANAGSSSDTALEERKAKVLEQISQLLGQSDQGGTKTTNPNIGDNQQLANVLALLNDNQSGAPVVPPTVQPPKPAPTNPSATLQQLLVGLNSFSNQASTGQQLINNSQPVTNLNPQAQLAALLQQQLQQQTQQNQQHQQVQPQASLLAALMNQGAAQTNQAVMLNSILNQSNLQNNQAQFLAMLANDGGQNQMIPANFLGALGQLTQQQALQQAQSKHQSFSQAQQQSTPSSTARNPSDSQGAQKRQRHVENDDVSDARSPSLTRPPSVPNQTPAQNPSIVSLLNLLSGNNGIENNASSVAAALSQLLSSMSQKEMPPVQPKPVDVFSVQQQSNQAPRNNNNALVDVLSLMQQQNNPQGFASSNMPPQAPVQALLAAIQQQSGSHFPMQSGDAQNSGSHDAVSGLLQQILGGAKLHQPVRASPQHDTLGLTTGNPVLDAPQRLVAPAAQSHPQQVPQSNNASMQLQQLLAGQNQAPPPTNNPVAASASNGQDFLSMLGLNQGGHGQTAATLQQLINNNSKRAATQNHRQQASSSSSVSVRFFRYLVCLVAAPRR